MDESHLLPRSFYRASHIVQVLELTTTSSFVYRSQLALRSPDKSAKRFTIEFNLLPVTENWLVFGSIPHTIEIAPLPLMEYNNLANFISNSCPQLKPSWPISVNFSEIDTATFFPFKIGKTRSCVITESCCDEY